MIKKYKVKIKLSSLSNLLNENNSINKVPSEFTFTNNKKISENKLKGYIKNLVEKKYKIQVESVDVSPINVNRKAPSFTEDAQIEFEENIKYLQNFVQQCLSVNDASLIEELNAQIENIISALPTVQEDDGNQFNYGLGDRMDDAYKYNRENG